MRRFMIATTVAVALTATACSSDNSGAPASDLAVTMASAYTAAPAGYSSLNSSYVGDEGQSFAPVFGRDDNHRGPGLHFGVRGRGPGFGLGFMGGGLYGGFIGNGFVRALFAANDPNCAYADGVVTCEPKTFKGLTVNRSYVYADSAGAPQERFSSSTSSVTANVSVQGTSTRRDSSTSTINLTSTQTVAGLGRGSDSITLNSASSGVEEAPGTSDEGAFQAKRVAADTVTGVVIPSPWSQGFHPYPVAGTIVRFMSVEVTISGQQKVSTTRREVITYDGSNVARVDITLDGETQNCTMKLPFGRLQCPGTESDSTATP